MTTIAACRPAAHLPRLDYDDFKSRGLLHEIPRNGDSRDATPNERLRRRKAQAMSGQLMRISWPIRLSRGG
jgi:hypothetical protein